MCVYIYIYIYDRQEARGVGRLRGPEELHPGRGRAKQHT